MGSPEGRKQNAFELRRTGDKALRYPERSLARDAALGQIQRNCCGVAVQACRAAWG